MQRDPPRIDLLSRVPRQKEILPRSKLGQKEKLERLEVLHLVDDHRVVAPLRVLIPQRRDVEGRTAAEPLPGHLPLPRQPLDQGLEDAPDDPALLDGQRAATPGAAGPAVLVPAGDPLRLDDRLELDLHLRDIERAALARMDLLDDLLQLVVPERRPLLLHRSQDRHRHLVDVEDREAGLLLLAADQRHIQLDVLTDRLGVTGQQDPQPLASEVAGAVHGDDRLPSPGGAGHLGRPATLELDQLLLGGMEKGDPPGERLVEDRLELPVALHEDQLRGRRLQLGEAARHRQGRRRQDLPPLGQFQQAEPDLDRHLVDQRMQLRLQPDLPQGRQPDLRHPQTEQVGVVVLREEPLAGLDGARLDEGLPDDRHLDDLPGARHWMLADQVRLRPAVGLVVVVKVERDPVLPEMVEDRPQVLVDPRRPDILTPRVDDPLQTVGRMRRVLMKPFQEPQDL